MLNQKLVLPLFTIFLFAGCQSQSPEKVSSNSTSSSASASSANNHTQTKEKVTAMQWQQAHVKYIRLEGGFYGLVTREGRKLLPLNLDKKYRQEGAVVKVKGVINRNVMTFHQWGEPFKITELTLIKAGRIKVE